MQNSLINRYMNIIFWLISNLTTVDVNVKF